MVVPFLNQDISAIDRLPQTVTEKPGFYQLISGLSDYIDESTVVLYDILTKITPIINNVYSPDIDLNYLHRLVIKCGINIDYLISDTSEDVIRQIYFIAIQGFVVKRLSNASKANMLELLNTIFKTKNTTITISDGGFDSNTVMSYTCDISGSSLPDAQNYYANYIKPLITGVTGTFTFITNGIFSSMLFSNGVEINPTDNPGGYSSFTGSLNTMAFEDGKEVSIISENVSQYNRTGTWISELK